MTYEEAISYLDALGQDKMLGLGPSLRRIEAICEALDHPERTVPAIHVGGTNGKTSVGRMATRLLMASGLKVATYSSPHLVSVTERLSLDGEAISEEDFAETFDHLMPYLEHVEADLGERLSYFEVLTALFFLWAAEVPSDALVVEVGLGGRWDATNVVPSQVQVITNVDLDHTALLGGDRVTIAREKAGIVKNGTHLVTGERAPDVIAILAEAAEAAETQLVRLGTGFEVDQSLVAVGGRYVDITTSARSYEGLFLPLHGAHQGTNAAVALEAVTRFLPAKELEPLLVAEGIGGVSAPGRLEVLRTADDISVVLDVAHNPAGMSALVTSLIEGFAFEKVLVVFGALSDKDHVGMLTELARLPAHMLITKPDSPRALGMATIGEVVEGLGLTSERVEAVPAAVGRAVSLATSADLICITGSHYVVGEARSLLVGLSEDR